jgi:HlyD family secretion protein
MFSPRGRFLAGFAVAAPVKCRASLPENSYARIVLPIVCVLPADETHSVYAVEEVPSPKPEGFGKAVKYRVQLGRADPGTVQVLGRRKATATTGPWVKFDGSELIVTGNLGALSDGVEVKVE